MRTKPVQALAAVLTASGKPLRVRRYPVLAPGPGWARLRLLASGICGTDIHIAEGRLAIPPPFIPGHEFVGRVDALGAGARRDALGAPLRVGDTAIACVARACGACFSCRRGETASCLRFGVTNFRQPDEPPHFFGGFAEVLQHPADGLVKVPAGLPVRAVAAFPCAGPTCIRACSYAGGLERDELVVVQGTGPVGLFAVAWAARAGCTVVAIGSGRNPARLRLARALGAGVVLDYRRTTAAERLEAVRKLATRLERGDGADVVIEASGAPAAVPEGLALCRTRGRYIVPGQYSSSGTVALAPEAITFRALRVTGSGQYTFADIADYLRFLGRHPDLQRRFAACVDGRFRVSEANRALRAVSAGRVAKGVFVP